MLLIEPVWNRNMAYGKERGRGRMPFNRTSMESKLQCCFEGIDSPFDF